MTSFQDEYNSVAPSKIILRNTVANKEEKYGQIYLRPINIFGKTDEEVQEETEKYFTKKNVGKYLLFTDEDEYAQRGQVDDYIVKKIINDDTTGKHDLISAVNIGKGFVIKDEARSDLRRQKSERIQSQRVARQNQNNPYGGNKKSKRYNKSNKKAAKKTSTCKRKTNNRK